MIKFDELRNIMFEKIVTPYVAFAVVSFCLGELGDGLNVFQGIYLVGLGWNKGAIGVALSLMGLTSLAVQTYAGDIIDKTIIDRRAFMTIAAVFTAASAMAIMFVSEGNNDHMLMYITKVVEGIASAFIKPCLAALTLSSFGSEEFDSAMANNLFWGNIGSAASAALAGSVAYVFYPNIKDCFFVIGASALCAILFVQFLPEGDPSLGRGFNGAVQVSDESTNLLQDSEKTTRRRISRRASYIQRRESLPRRRVSLISTSKPDNQIASSYLSVFSERRTLVLCVTGFFFHFANANVLLVLGELMGKHNNDDDKAGRAAIPLVAGAILLAQGMMSATTVIGCRLTENGVGRKILFLLGLITLPIRCALIIYWRDAGASYLLSTQILDGVGSGFFWLIHAYLVADITIGSGRFNVIMGLTASSFSLGSALSNYIGQIAVQNLGPVISLSGSLAISIVPIIIFSLLMPETLNTRSQNKTPNIVDWQKNALLVGVADAEDLLPLSE